MFATPQHDLRLHGQPELVGRAGSVSLGSRRSLRKRHGAHPGESRWCLRFGDCGILMIPLEISLFSWKLFPFHTWDKARYLLQLISTPILLTTAKFQRHAMRLWEDPIIILSMFYRSHQFCCVFSSGFRGTRLERSSQGLCYVITLGSYDGTHVST